MLRAVDAGTASIRGLTEALSNFGNCCGPVPCLLLKSNVEEKVEAKELADEFLSEDEDEEASRARATTRTCRGGSKKEGAATKQVKVAEIHDVVNAAFDDAPPNMDPACMLCFNISNRAGLKIIAHSKTDATVLIHGFKLLTEPKNADIDQIRAKAIMV
ncbi:hypothetical protein JL720_8308 [Aureococcus anophagefferens]|nr:hypothetical protein JL720_8308 [Aureococcus anophagefferens]